MGGHHKLDALLVGGDLVDHIQNVYPYRAGADVSALQQPTARTVWDLVNLRQNYDQHYQAFVDFISFFGVLCWFYRSFGKPIFGITGNHDCYEEAFGVSPRVGPFGTRANEGIPADLNLTFYESILAFGPTWDVVRRTMMPSNFTPELFDWFYSVLTPFSDFAVELPKQRVVGLAWGEDEALMTPKGQGLGHLPRADEAVTAGQLALFQRGFGPAKRTVLVTHFTFVSYTDSIQIATQTSPEGARVANAGQVILTDSFGDHDLGTFEHHRRELYDGVADTNSTQFVVTGHSHRKGLYFLRARAAGNRGPAHYNTDMFGMRRPVKVAELPIEYPRTPIVVSDSSGPLPRLNLMREFEGWGSDRPAGTRIENGADNRVAVVEAVPSTLGRAKPRLAVALDYLHWLKDHVFDEIETYPFDKRKPLQAQHGLVVRFDSRFPRTLVQLDGLTLFHKASVAAPWTKLGFEQELTPPTSGNLELKFRLDATTRPEDFMSWLTFGPKAGRFGSFQFSVVHPDLDDIYDGTGAWNLELDCRPAHTNMFFMSDITYVILPGGGHDKENPREVVEAPCFEWRRRFPAYQ